MPFLLFLQASLVSPQDDAATAARQGTWNVVSTTQRLPPSSQRAAARIPIHSTVNACVRIFMEPHAEFLLNLLTFVYVLLKK